MNRTIPLRSARELKIMVIREELTSRERYTSREETRRRRMRLVRTSKHRDRSFYSTVGTNLRKSAVQYRGLGQCLTV